MFRRTALLSNLVWAVGCGGDARPAPEVQAAVVPAASYTWERVVENAPFPPSYNFPVHVDVRGRFVALHPEGTWTSADGGAWEPSTLPWSGMNAAYLRYVHHNGATWALGLLEGNYERFNVIPRIQRTADYEAWELVGSSATLPQVVFYAAASFQGDLWILGGYDGRDESASVWRSSNGLDWVRVLDRAPWSPRQGAGAIVFRDRLFVFGGGELDGQQFKDVWSSDDGVTWRLESPRLSDRSGGGSAIVFDGRLWFVGVNRDSGFSPGVLISEDGRAWREETAPWSPRGGVAVWTNGVDLFMTGGKYSEVRGGETVFTYYNDVWRARVSTRPGS